LSLIRARWGFIMSPPWLNTRSTAALVAGTDNTVVTSRYSLLR